MEVRTLQASLSVPKRSCSAPLGAPEDPLVQHSPLTDLRASTSNEINLSAPISGTRLAPSKITLGHNSSDEVQFIFSKYLQRLTPSSRLLHPQSFYLHTTFGSKTVLSYLKVIATHELSDQMIGDLSNMVRNKKSLSTGGIHTPRLRYVEEFQSLESKGLTPHTTHHYLTEGPEANKIDEFVSNWI